MKTTLLTSIAAVAALTFFTVSCKKDNTEDPVNINEEEQAPCSLCLGEMLEVDENTHLIIGTGYASQTTFLKDGVVTGPNQIANKTPMGFYGYQGGVSIAFNGAELPMICSANKITFVHARFNNISALVNVQFPGTPLLSVFPDSLAPALAPYGYTVENYSDPGQVWMGSTPGWTGPGFVDSIIIHGPEFETVTVGADLFESELRSICIAHE